MRPPFVEEKRLALCGERRVCKRKQKERAWLVRTRGLARAVGVNGEARMRNRLPDRRCTHTRLRKQQLAAYGGPKSSSCFPRRPAEGRRRGTSRQICNGDTIVVSRRKTYFQRYKKQTPRLLRYRRNAIYGKPRV